MGKIISKPHPPLAVGKDTIEELADAQGVKPVSNLDSYLGGWPKDEIDDGFEATVRRWRDQERLPG